MEAEIRSVATVRDEAAATPTAARDTLIELFQQSVAYLRPYRWQIAAYLVTILVDVAFGLTFYYGVKVIVDNAVAQRGAGLLPYIVGGLAAFFIVSTGSSIAADYIAADVEARLAGDLRLRLLQQLQTLSLDFYARSQVSDLVSHFSQDVEDITDGVTDAFPSVVHRLIQIVAALAFLMILDWRLALVTLVALPVAFIVPRALLSRSIALAEREQEDDLTVLATVEETIEGQATVTAYGLQDMLLAAFRRQLSQVAQVGIPASRYARLTVTASGSAISFMVFLATAVGAVLVYRHSLSVGTLLGFLGIVGLIGTSFNGLISVGPEWAEAAIPLRSVQDVLSERPAIDDKPDAAALASIEHEIRFADVSFHYPQVGGGLQDASLTVRAGASVALVGRSGAGKSTALMLLLRFYDPVSGQVAIDGRDVRDITQRSLRHQFGIVFQELFLFDRSIRENIRLGRPDATDAEVEEAAREAHVHDDILQLPAGYDTLVGRRGGRLSGGERQRIALARALLRKPPVLLLDEATSSLDPATESAFIKTLHHVTKDRTLVTVTHRLSTVTGADCIFVLEAGRVVEEGTHEALLERGGAYRRLWEQQTGFVVSGDGMTASVTPDRLRQIPLFASADERVLAAVADRFAVQRFQPGMAIVEQGQEGEVFYLLVRGSAEVVKVGDDQQEHRYNVLQDGDFFGEIALLRNTKRTATVRALTPCLVLALSRESFNDLLEQSPDLRESMDKTATIRLQELEAGPPAK